MPKLVLAASLLAAIIIGACGTSAPTPSQPPATPSAPPSAAPSVVPPPASPDPSPTGAPPVATPDPTAEPSPKPTAKPTPRPSAPSFSHAERYLIDGIMRGESDCFPVRGDDLPGQAIAGIDCDLVATPVARMGFYLFESDQDMVDAYLARMRAEGIGLESGDACQAGDAESESAYIPWAGDDIAPYRNGCFVNTDGFGNYRATLPEFHVYVGLLGRNANMQRLREWAWFGATDTPGSPTLWQQSFVYSR